LIAKRLSLKFRCPQYKMHNIQRSYSFLAVILIPIILLLSACGRNSPTVLPVNPTSTDTPGQPSPTIAIHTQTPYIITASPEGVDDSSGTKSVFFLSFQEKGNFHLFAFSPQKLPLTRLTADPWDDITPALSPDGKSLAFSSRRNGYWDLYLLNLFTGTALRLTDTRDYDAAPSWSPDGAFVAYESYTNNSMDIFIRSVLDLEQAPLQLTQNSASNQSPAWSPLGRQIAFISNRSGNPEVWVADLDNAGSFINVSNNPQSVEKHPAWSPDGTRLAWASTSTDTGLTGIYVFDTTKPRTPPKWIGSGDWPAWQDNNNIATVLSTPNQTFLTGFSSSNVINIPPIALPGEIYGFTYGISSAVMPGPFQAAAQKTESAISGSGSTSETAQSQSRVSLVTLSNTTAPYPKLNELAAGSFQELRNQVSSQIDWDALGNLENAFIPLTTPPDPGLGDDWLYTGRAITLNPALIQANWMVVVREDFGQQVYWRIYLRTNAQDGSQGMPLTQVPWDFSARTTSSFAYENGGQLMGTIPAGFWFDLTAQAAIYGWQRLPALTNWRTYYAGARLNELIFPQSLDWRSSMLQLYPPEVLVTPTIVIPPTRTPTRTPFWYTSPTPTKTPTNRPTTTP
jgi:TolB protein